MAHCGICDADTDEGECPEHRVGFPPGMAEEIVRQLEPQIKAVGARIWARLQAERQEAALAAIGRKKAHGANGGT